ncbi:MAG: hypothetical protein HZA89_05760 [Verrucomicrobia bacterium]|nr:hypothetical protein [Verrucomicrobiota bacterium]
MKLPLAIALSLAVAAEAGSAPSVPDFGIMLNDDGGQSFTDLDPKRSEAALRVKIRSLEGTAVRTLIYQVVAGSEIALYPTKVGSMWGWRKAPGESASPWNQQMPFLRAAVTNGLDAGRTAGEEARAMGLRFMPGYRMNDAHFSSKPFDHPATGRFWIENHERFKIGSAPSERMRFVANLLDYSHTEVRAHRLGIVREIIGRYADIMDGVQLDFMRQPYLFPPGTGEARRDLMTEFIAQVRAKLDEAGKQQGRFLCLSVRVPPTLQGCRWAGLDVKAWLDRRLVNVLVLSPAMTLAHDMPVDEFVALAEPTGAKVYPAVFRHTPFIWPFTTEPTADSYRRSPSHIVTAAQVRGAALNYLPMGAAGFELFNFNLPPAQFTLDAIAALANPRNGQRIYAITQAYASDREDTEYRKQIPVALSPASPAELTLIVGEDLTGRDLCNQTHAALRLGLHGLGKQQPNLRIEINGRPIYDGPVAQIATPVSGRESQPSRLNPPRVETYLQVRVTDGAVFRAGRNKLSLRLQAPDARTKVQVVEAQLTVLDGG